MFSISFGEMGIILLVVLLVVGPKRLPEMARFLGHLLGRLNRQARSIKSEIKREMEIEDLRTTAKEVADAVTDVKEEIRFGVAQATKDVQEATDEQEPSIAPKQMTKPAATDTVATDKQNVKDSDKKTS